MGFEEWIKSDLHKYSLSLALVRHAFYIVFVSPILMDLAQLITKCVVNGIRYFKNHMKQDFCAYVHQG